MSLFFLLAMGFLLLALDCASVASSGCFEDTLHTWQTAVATFGRARAAQLRDQGCFVCDSDADCIRDMDSVMATGIFRPPTAPLLLV